MLKENPFLLTLPRIGLSLTRPSNYRIWAEPSPECVSTIEAAVLLLCGWGPYAISLLRAAEAPLRDFADLRLACARSLGRRPGGVEQAVRLLGREELPPGAGEGRAGRRLGCLVEVLGRMVG